ncbi:zeta toxin family protein [uncultured Microbacterium sp.]|uniref:zeta toxin family protein n=1 Tax=uncultured Microbacterium sp. TaxID=191216 RepID=UPI0025D42A49|nr:zeta toxin family protein [uncultured Microbacterium sp.]
MSEAEPWIESEFYSIVLPELFRAATPNATPVWIGIGGQPGAGKTAGRQTALRLAGAANVVPIIGDDLRTFHPDYSRLMREAPLEMPERTQEASGAWVELALEHAARERINTLVEGTFRRPEVTLATAQRFKNAGFRTHLVALAVAGWESRLSTVERFVADFRNGRAARWTPMAAHEAGLLGTPRTVRAAERDVTIDRISIVTRRGDVLFDGSEQARAGAAAALLREQERAPSATTVREWTERYRAVAEYVDREVPRTAQTVESLRALKADSVSLHLAEKQDR